MKFALLVLLCAAAAQAQLPMTRYIDPLPNAPVIPAPRIVNGQQATKGQFNYQAGVLIGGTGFCGGSLIATNWVLTAAHCVQSTFWDVTLGQQQRSAASEEGRVTVRTSTRVVNADYNAVTLANDIALLNLGAGVTLSRWIGLVPLPTRSDAGNAYANVGVTVSGWGKLSDASSASADQLNFVRLTTITNAACAAVYGTAVINSAVICTASPGGQGTCNGDSGGPLVLGTEANPKLIGVVSFVSSAGCASGNPAGFERVTSHLDWIQNNSGITIRP